ncbi:MAG: hypothetical protein NVSMB1_13380 [Polyangiales bacterium]
MKGALSVLPPSRHFGVPRVPFDTEVAVLAGKQVTIDPRFAGVWWFADQDFPELPRTCIVRACSPSSPSESQVRNVSSTNAGPARRDGHALGVHIAARFREARNTHVFPPRQQVIFESRDDADLCANAFQGSSFRRTDLDFYGIGADDLARIDAPAIELESLVGDEAWHRWGQVERVILEEALETEHLPMALLDRSVQFKRSQQRASPPIRRFVAHDSMGEKIGMIGYAAFAQCKSSFADDGVLVRLRDVAVLPAFRSRGYGRGLLSAVAERAIAECGATQVVICGSSTGRPSALYRSVGAKTIGHCAILEAMLTKMA